MKKTPFLLPLLAALTLAACDEKTSPASTASETSAPAASAPAAPAAAPSAALLDPGSARETAPAEFRVKLETTQGPMVVKVTRAWSPNGADRFYNLVKVGYYDDTAFFRVIDGFMAQIGIHGQPAVNSVWRGAQIMDDPGAGISNQPWHVTFAKTGMPNSRTTQIFFNFGDNRMLDGQGFTPFGVIIEGGEVLGRLYRGYGEGAPSGNGPDQMRAQSEGNAYLKREFPKLDYIKTARVL